MTTTASKPQFSKAAIRSTYQDVFVNHISRFVFPSINQPRTRSSSRFIICARVRPFLEQEIIQKDIYNCITTTDDQLITVHAGYLRLNNLEMKHTTYRLDHIFSQQSSNNDVYKVVRNTIAQSIPRGDTLPVDSTVFLFGKTGTGKSHTISGIAQLFAHDVFYLIKNSHYDLRLGISAVEIVAGSKGFIVSNDNVCDLFNNGTIVHFRDDENGTMHLRGAAELACDGSNQLDMYIKQAKAIRRTQATLRNTESSRSHLIYFIRLRTAAHHLQDGEILSTITFVDLAGSEGQQDSLYFKGNSDKVRDSTSINRSLSALKDCIRASASGAKIIPFRGCVLTRLLKKCFCSKESRSVFIGTVSGLSTDVEQNAQTLRYSGLIKWNEADFILEQRTKLKADM